MPPGPVRDDAVGNSWADHAAVRARQIDHPFMDTLLRKAYTWHGDQYRQSHCILAYLADLNLHHVQLKQQSRKQNVEGLSQDAALDWGTLYRQRENYKITLPAQMLQPSIHPGFLTACVWGNQYADLVLQFCAALRWPDPTNPSLDMIAKQGITWHELTVAFAVNTGIQFPTWIRPEKSKRAQPFPWQDPRVLALPITRRSLREQAEAFRTIVLYLQKYSSSPILPAHSKTGSISLTQIGWGRSYLVWF